MPQSFGQFGKGMGRMGKAISRGLPRAAMRGGTVIQLRAKEIVQQKGHIRTSTLFRGITTQLGPVTKTSATSLVGASPVYSESVEKLPVGARIPRSVTKSGNIINRGEGGGYLFPASVEKLSASIRAAADSLEETIRDAARGGAV